MIQCPHCDGQVFALAKEGDRLKARTSIIVLHKSGDVEINCTHCKKGILLPLAAVPGKTALQKAQEPARRQRLTLKKGVDSPG
jgi:hypothetical protein